LRKILLIGLDSIYHHRNGALFEVPFRWFTVISTSKSVPIPRIGDNFARLYKFRNVKMADFIPRYIENTVIGTKNPGSKNYLHQNNYGYDQSKIYSNDAKNGFNNQTFPTQFQNQIQPYLNPPIIGMVEDSIPPRQ
jgi:hypothetical protein